MRLKSETFRSLLGLCALMLVAAGPSVDPGAATSASEASMPPVTNGPITLSAKPMPPQTPPDLSLAPSDSHPFERTRWPHNVLLRQWSLAREVPPESIISERYLRTRDRGVHGLSLKETIYLAIKGNPGVQAARLDPVASLEAVRQNYAVFDPNLTAHGDISKDVTPTTSALQTGNKSSFVQKNYDWNFGVDKVLATTNGTFGINFTNSRLMSNSAFAALNPSYNTFLALSLSQPLLRDFGLDFATINVRIAETNQKQSQFNYEQELSDFVLRVGVDYWNVVRAEENLQVARDALKLAQDLVRQNEISFKVGVLAPIAVQEAQSEAATREAGVYQAEGALDTARATLRQDVMLNPAHTFLPQQIEPTDRPSPEAVPVDEEQSLEQAMKYRPELAAMREAIRSMLLQVRYAENQTLPKVNLGTQFGLNASAGTNPCLAIFSGSFSNCTANPPGGGTAPGARVPFGGIYGDALNRLWGFSFYNYAVALDIEQPLMNDAAKAALAQTKIEYEQQRLRYRDSISQVVVDVEHALSDVATNYKRARATKLATEYAAKSLRDEQERFRVGMATTHELLQFQNSLVAAQGNQVQAELDFETAKLSLRHAEGGLLRAFNVSFEPREPEVRPWYSRF